MADPTHLAILERGVDAWNRWRDEHSDARPDLEGADLRGRRLVSANLSRALLNRADLSESVLSLANLEQAELRQASLLDARLVEVRCAGADLEGAVLARATLADADLRGAKLGGADLSYATLIRVDLSAAKLSNCAVYGVGAWDLVTDSETDQRELVVSLPEEPPVRVDDIEVAQLVRLLMTHAKLRNVLSAVMERGVLLLGRFGDGGLELLGSLAEALRTEGYSPMIFDFERPKSRNYTETVTTLAGLSRFIVAELSGPSVPQELWATVPRFKIPFVPLLERGQRPYGMLPDVLEYPWVLEPIRYSDEADLVARVPAEFVAPAETKHAERQARLERHFGE